MDLQKDYLCMENNARVMTKRIELEADYQETLPAYCDDIYRVVKCVGRSYINAVDINYNEIKVFGRVQFMLTYFNERAELCYTDFEEEFSKTVAVDGLSDAAFVCGDFCDKYTNYRVINQRRIDIHQSSKITLEVYDKIKCPSLTACEGAKLKTQTVNASCVLQSRIAKMEFDEEFTLPASLPPIQRVISFGGVPTLGEVKVIKDKAFIKANLNVTVLYTADGDEPATQTAEYSFQVSKIMESPGIQDNDIPIVKLSVGSLYVKAKASDSSSVNTLNVFGDIIANVRFIREFSQELVTDGYLPGYQSNCDYAEYPYAENGRLISEAKTVHASFPLPDGVNKIEEMNIAVSDEAVKNGRLSASLQLSAVGRTESGELLGISAGDTMETEIEENAEAVAVLNILSADYTLGNGGTLDVRLNTALTAYAFSPVNKSVLSDITDNGALVSAPSLTLYFGKGGESVWEIAKRFSSDEEMIKNENGIDGDAVASASVLIIPKA